MAYLKMGALAMKWALTRPATTRYPARPRQPIAKSRGQLVTNKTTCTYCTACAIKCPTSALRVDRKKKTFAVDRLRCITCGYCVEICPKKSLELSTSHGVPTIIRDVEY